MAGKTERREIKVASVSNWRAAGKAQVLEFIGADRVPYETFAKEFAEYIKVGAEIEADVEFTEKAVGDKVYYHNRVTALYVDGQPVKVTRSRSAAATEESPEKRVSIENQTRADLICQLWVAGKLEPEDTLVKKLRNWLGKIDADGAKPSPAKGEAAAKMAPQDGQFENAGQFLTACSKDPLKLSKTQVLNMLGIKTIEEIKDFSQAYNALIDLKR